MPVRWLAPDNLHLTLLPPWLADDKTIEEIADQLEELKYCCRPFNIRFTEVVYGPQPRKPSLICALGKAPAAMIRLKQTFELALGRPAPARPYLLHLTLARFHPENFSSFKVKKLNDKIFWQEKADSFQLIESLLKPDGAEYKILKAIKFSP